MTLSAAAEELRSAGTEVPYVRAPDATNEAHIERTGELTFVRRAVTPKQWEGDISFTLDSARPGALSTDPDGRIVGRIGVGGGLGLRLTATRGGATAKYRPGIGAFYQFVGRDGGPLSIALAVDYRPEGFNEVKGEVEAGLHITYAAKRAEITGNFVGGMEPGFKQGDLEAAISAGYRLLPNLLVGAQGRHRLALPEAMYEDVVGLMASYRVWRAQVTAVAGAEALTIFDTRYGLIGSIGVAFGF